MLAKRIGQGARRFATQAAEAGGKASGSRRMLGLVGFGSLCAGTFGLGAWQTARYFEKFELTEKRCEELDDEPVALWDLVGTLTGQLSATNVPSRRIVVNGRFAEGRDMLVGPRPPPKDFPRELLGSDTAGYLLISVFVDSDG